MARGIVDKWKTKKKFDVLAPKLFNNNAMGITFAKSADMLVGRILEVPYSDVVGFGASRIQDKLKLIFEIVSTKGDKAETKLRRFKMAQDYTHSLSRKRTSKIYTALNVRTKNDKRLRVKSFVITRRKINRSKQDALRRKMRAFIAGDAKRKDGNEFLKECIEGRAAGRMKKFLDKLYPLRHAIVEKIEIKEAGVTEETPKIEVEKKEVKEAPVEEKKEEPKKEVKEAPKEKKEGPKETSKEEKNE